jgi:hypothetical protein
MLHASSYLVFLKSAGLLKNSVASCMDHQMWGTEKQSCANLRDNICIWLVKRPDEPGLSTNSPSSLK